ncbi:MAG TPA: MarR family transcriptional regulator [Gammaproteobacteria bacterium]|nr:MarR family transcriptional regulator [Gammaproteobacteria bacterium]
MPKKPEAHGTWLKLDKPAHIIGFLLKSLQHTLRQTIEEALRNKGIELSFAHFAALFTIESEPGITGAKLARRAMVSAQTMNSALRKLESDGRIERRPHPESRRADSWTVTGEGLELLNQARAVGNGIFERMLAPLDRAETAALESSLRRCIAALEADGQPAWPREPGAAPRRNVKRTSRQPEAR